MKCMDKLINTTIFLIILLVIHMSDNSYALQIDRYIPQQGNLIYIQNIEGARYTFNNTPIGINWNDNKIVKTISIYDSLNKDITPFRFIEYSEQNSRLFIRAIYKNLREVWIEIFNTDDFLNQPPRDVKYDRLIISLKNELNNCAKVINAIRFIQRYFYISERLKRTRNVKLENEMLDLLKRWISKCSGNASIGPDKTFNISRINKNNNSSLSNLFCNECNTECYDSFNVLPDSIIRHCYNNLTFLIPAWCSYNNKRISTTGVKNNCTVMSRRNDKTSYSVLIPSIEELIKHVDIPTILGHSFKQINIENKIYTDINVLSSVIKKFQEKQNCIAFTYKISNQDSYFSVSKVIYKNNGLTEYDYFVIAKVLREFNREIKDNKMIDDDNLLGNNLSIKRYENNELEGVIIIPSKLDTLSVEFNKPKLKPQYRLYLH